MATVTDIKFTFVVQKTNARLYDQSVSYNEPGVTYNQDGIAYGGRYEYDVVPLLSQSRVTSPTISGYRDIYVSGTVVPPASNSYGSGWFMFIPNS